MDSLTLSDGLVGAGRAYWSCICLCCRYEVSEVLVRHCKYATGVRDLYAAECKNMGHTVGWCMVYSVS